MLANRIETEGRLLTQTHLLIDARGEPRKAGISTYRIQVHGQFPLSAVREVVPYLAALGVSGTGSS